jgi:hypothetical protein
MRQAISVATATALASFVVASPASAFTATPDTGRLSTIVTVHARVAQGDNSYEPAFYVDWRNGTCPTSVEAARNAAIGNTTRGLGLAALDNGSSTTDIPISAKVTLEQERQRVCLYGGGGTLDDQGVILATIGLPPLERGLPVHEWFTDAIAKITIDRRVHRDPLGWALLLAFNGPRPSKGILTCNRKRFYLTPSRIKLGADGSLAYAGSIRADNSNAYDAPIPIKYFGHATLRFHAPLDFGRTPISEHITSDIAPRSSFTFPLGAWGLPVSHVNARFTAPGFHPYTGEPSCGPQLKAIANPSTGGAVMIGQGTAALGGTREAGTK